MGCTPEYDYIVVGSGAGGGTVAARLVEEGHEVLLLEAGGDPMKLQGGGPRGGPNRPNRLPDDYRVPAFHTSATENDAIKWDFWVRHYANNAAQKRDPKYYPVHDGVLYPRARALGGCTAHNAMTTVCPHDFDWERIQTELNDPSWSARAMRRYFVRIENCHYRPFWRLIKWISSWNPLRHGFDGWLHTQRAPLIRLGLRDCVLARIIIKSAIQAIRELRAPRGIQWLYELFASFDPNDGRPGNQAEGVYYVPLSTNRRARCGTLEFLIDIQRKYPGKLTIELNSIVTKVTFQGKRATGVELLPYETSHNRQGAGPETGKPNISEKKPEPRIAKKEVILSCGAFNTPQILMLSGIGPANQLANHGIPVVHELRGVGQNLQDRYEVSVVCRLKKELNLLKGIELRSDDPHGMEWTQFRDGVYTTNGIALAVISHSNPPAKTNTTPKKQAPPDLFSFLLFGKFRGYYPDYSLNPISNYLTWTILKAHTENVAGVVTLNPANPLDQPKIDFKYFKEGTNGGQRDLESVVEGIKFVRKLTVPISDLIEEEELPGPLIDTQKDLEQWVEDRAWGHHACGTCKIGPAHDVDAVLDKNFRVRGVQNLRVVDASIFPRIPGFFIVSAIYMIAEKASEDILADADPSRRRKPPEPLRARIRRLISGFASIFVGALWALLQLTWQPARAFVLAFLALILVLGALALVDPYLAATKETGINLNVQLERLSLLPLWGLPLAIILLIFNLTLTLIHALQELKGRTWDYFGDIAGVRIPDALGILVFFIILLVGLWIVGFIGIVGYPPISDATRIFLIAGLIGVRVSDRWWGHVRPNRQGYRPNPGLSSSHWGLAEAIILTIVFLKGIAAFWLVALIGFFIGWLVFYAVLPALKLFAKIFPDARKPPWQPGEPRPSSR